MVTVRCGRNLGLNDAPIGVGQKDNPRAQLPSLEEVPRNNKNNPAIVQDQQAPDVHDNYKVAHNDVGATSAIVAPPLPSG